MIISPDKYAETFIYAAGHGILVSLDVQLIAENDQKPDKVLSFPRAKLSKDPIHISYISENALIVFEPEIQLPRPEEPYNRSDDIYHRVRWLNIFWANIDSEMRNYHPTVIRADLHW